jgi:surface carbohydrate biosynthesis protein
MALILRKKILLFPVETTVRELDFRLILGILVTRPDWQILVGEHQLLFKLSLRLRNVVSVLKNVTGGKRPWKYRRWKELNHRIIHLDEEGAIYEQGPERWKIDLNNRLIVPELDANDHVCTWGTFQADHYRSLNPACSANINAVGHPRFDLSGPAFDALYQEEARQLRERHGKFILVNTNILASNVTGRDVYFRFYGISPEDTVARTHYIEHYCHEAQREAAFIELINHLSNTCPEHQIVFRPHPSEDLRAYEVLLKYIPRVTITRNGSLHAWLRSCQVLVHDGCTTAIEAHLGNTPVINFHPIHDPRFEITLPNLVGIACSTPAEVADAIMEIDHGCSRAITPPDHLDRLTLMIRNLDPSWDSFAEFAKIIRRCQDETADAQLVGTLPPLGWHRFTDPLRRSTSIQKAIKPFLSQSQRGNNKFPPFDPDEIRNKLNLLEPILGVSADVHFHSSMLLSLTSRESTPSR